MFAQHRVDKIRDGRFAAPIVAARFVLVPRHPTDANAARSVLDLLAWGYAKGGTIVERFDDAPLPPKVVALVEERWRSDIIGADGQPVWTRPRDPGGR